jgi:hypothetical protein
LFLGLTEKTGCDDAATLYSVLFRDLTSKQFFRYFASINLLIFVVEILMNVTTPFRRKLTTRFGAN